MRSRWASSGASFRVLHEGGGAVVRRGPGDEARVWTGFCAAFDRYAREADRHGLTARWRSLVADVRAGRATATDVRLLLAELAERRGHLEDFVGRDGTLPAPADEDVAATAYACPQELCHRRDALGPAGPVPHCPAWGLDMVDPVR
ncbi:hypothetical protein AB0I60_03265 [Actinosynnema sp. NPDC050436]|uniref:hypothetical protein n=1 Tax=Actinosynnema sp. NPDC050436 TaxID=3155659 RepID=UPI0033C103C1